MKLKFKKKAKTLECRVRWDTQIENDKFYRILVNGYGYYVLYFCEGIEENGITPKKMTELWRSLYLQSCKDKAQADANSREPKKTAATYYTAGCVGEIRLPYKD